MIVTCVNELNKHVWIVGSDNIFNLLKKMKSLESEINLQNAQQKLFLVFICSFHQSIVSDIYYSIN